MTDSPPYPAIAVANFFLSRAQEEGKPVSQLKLQKLVYFAHGWHLAIKDEPLIEERIEAWEFGPVVHNIYRKAKKYGRDPIPEKLDGNLYPDSPEDAEIPTSDTSTRNLLNRVWESYKDYTAGQLSAMTHKSDWAWHQKWHEEGAKHRRHVAIPDEYIQKDFEELQG